MTLIIESENKDFIKGLKSLAKATNAKVRIKTGKRESKKDGALKEAIREVEQMKLNPHLYKGYSDIETLARALRDEI